MKHGRWNTNRIVAALVSMTLAIPLPLMAQSTPVPKMGAAYSFMATPRWEKLPVREATPGQAGVAVTTFKSPDGQEITATYTQVDAADAADAFEKAAAQNPDATIVATGDENDPALSKIKKRGWFSRVKSIFSPRSADEVSIVANPEVPQDIRTKLKAGIRKFVGDWKNDKVGTAFVVTYSTVMGTITYLQAGSVGATCAQLLPTIMWASLMTVYSAKAWFKYTGKAGELAEHLAAMNGRAPGAYERYAYNSTGKLAASFLANCGMALITLFNQSTLIGPFQVMFLGMLMNSNVIDPTVERWVHEGKVSETFLKRYALLAQIVGASLELATIAGWAYGPVVLGSIVSAGLTYLYAGPWIEKKVSDLKKWITRKVGKTKSNCDRFLAPFLNPPVEEFVAWATIKHGPLPR